ncbi:MAG: alpha-hydroxy-acid oxidizing protein, partial [Thermoplasmata archaeon]
MTEPFRTLRELEELASTHLTGRVGAYVHGGSGDERTLRENRTAFHRWVLRPRVLTDVHT